MVRINYSPDHDSVIEILKGYLSHMYIYVYEWGGFWSFGKP
jgi:hypothetical protein